MTEVASLCLHRKSLARDKRKQGIKYLPCPLILVTVSSFSGLHLQIYQMKAMKLMQTYDGPHKPAYFCALVLSCLPPTGQPSSPAVPYFSTHRNSKNNGSSEAPDQSIIDGEPTEVWVPVAFRVQAHSKPYRRFHTEVSAGRRESMGP